MQQDEFQKKRNSYLVRLLVGVVVLYYSYSLYGNLSDAAGTKWYVLLVFAVLFFVAAAVMIIWGLVGLIKCKSESTTTEDTGENETVTELQDEAKASDRTEE